MHSELIAANSLAGTFTKMHTDGDELIVQNGQDVSGIVEANKREFNSDHGANGDGLGRKVASIPLSIYFDLRKKGITRDRKAFARWLNDPDNAVFRTAPGHV